MLTITSMSLILMCLGTAISFTTNPANTTTCLGSTATFMCSTDQPTGGIEWFINGALFSDTPGAQRTSPSTNQIQSTLTVPTYSVPNGINVRCYFYASGARFLGDVAFLTVQGLFTCLSVCLFPLPCSCAILHPISSTLCTF